MGTRSEHVEQREFVSWFRKRYRPTRIFAIPNGGKRGKAEAMRLKAEGVSPGVPDLFIPAWKVWIEMKAVGGKASDEQADWAVYLEGEGYQVWFCWGFEDAQKKCIEYENLCLQGDGVGLR